MARVPVIGFVFTEFLNFVDTEFTPVVTEDMVGACDLPTGGAYTTVGNYDHTEMFALVDQLSKLTGRPRSALFREFGGHLLSALLRKNADALAEITDPLMVIEALSQNYDADVLGLYPDADVQALTCNRTDAGAMEVIYRSRHHLADVIEGVIGGVFAHFKTPVTIERHDEIDTETEQWVRFLLTSRGPQTA